MSVAHDLVIELLEGSEDDPKELLGRLLRQPGLVQAGADMPREDVASANADLKKFFRAKGREQWAAQYEWTLVDVRRDGWGPETKYSFKYWPKGGKDAQVQTDSGYAYDVRQFRTPKAALAHWRANIAEPERYAYRGMNMAEWVEAKRRGYIQSRGTMNLVPGAYTSFATDWSSAHSYAGPFTAYYDEPTRSMPGVIVAVPIELTQPADARGVGTASERVATQVPVDQVQGVWFLTPVQTTEGTFDLIRKYDGRLEDGSRSSPSVNYAVVPKAGIALGSG